MALDPLTVLIGILTAALAARTLFFVSLSVAHYIYADRTLDTSDSYRPFVSILVPCFNEELTVRNCVASLLRQTYKNFEIILINDGSTDATESICEQLARENPTFVKTYSKRNGGKASALNHGIACAEGDIIVTIDADSVFVDNTLSQLVRSFADDTVSAVAGNVKVANRASINGELQAAEYIVGLNMYRRAFAQINCIPVISGAVGAFRKEALVAVGGYSSDTLVEDMDLTIALGKDGHRIVYNEWAIAYTEAPETLSQVYKQRYRWTFGGFQVLKKYRSILFKSAYGNLGLISLPYFALSPFITMGFSVFFLSVLILFVVTGNLVALLSFYVAYVGTQFVLLFFSLTIDAENKKLLRTVLIDIFWQNIFLGFIVMRAWIAHVSRMSASWNTLQRFGKNIAPIAA